MRTRACLVLTLLLTTACGQEPPSPEELEDARARAELAVHAAHQARLALELLGLLPVYTCGEPRRTFVGQATQALQTKVTCVTATRESLGEGADALVLSFPEGGCGVNGHTVAGRTAFLFSGGEDRMDVSADLRGLSVDGYPLPARVGYGTCGDEVRVWTEAEGELPERPGTRYRVDGRVGVREGLPLIGGTTLVFDGPGELSGPLGTDRLTLTGLHYEVGAFLPSGGEALIETASGRRVRVRFSEVLWRLGKAEVAIDDKVPVTVPIVH